LDKISEPAEGMRTLSPRDTKFIESPNRGKSRILTAAEVDEDYGFPIYFFTLLAYNLYFLNQRWPERK
jgi:hypothetical protein